MIKRLFLIFCLIALPVIAEAQLRIAGDAAILFEVGAKSRAIAGPPPPPPPVLNACEDEFVTSCVVWVNPDEASGGNNELFTNESPNNTTPNYFNDGAGAGFNSSLVDNKYVLDGVSDTLTDNALADSGIIAATLNDDWTYVQMFKAGDPSSARRTFFGNRSESGSGLTLWAHANTSGGFEDGQVLFQYGNGGNRFMAWPNAIHSSATTFDVVAFVVHVGATTVAELYNDSDADGTADLVTKTGGAATNALILNLTKDFRLWASQNTNGSNRFAFVGEGSHTQIFNEAFDQAKLDTVFADMRLLEP